MKRLLTLLACFVAIVLVAAGCSSSGGLSSSAAATVNGQDISMSELNDDLAVLANSTTYKANLEQNGTQVYGTDGKTYTTQFSSGWLSVLIQNELVEQQLASLGGSVTPDETSQAQQTYQQLGQSGEVPQEFLDRLIAADANQLALKRVIEAAAPPAEVTDEEVRAYYDENIDATMQQVGGDVACVLHITAPFDISGTGQTAGATPEQEAAAEAKIDEVAARIRAGEDSATVANSYPQTATAEVAGGDLGCVPKGGGQLPQELEDAIYNAPVGEMVGPIQSTIGVHLVFVKTRGVLPFEEAEQTIRKQLEEQKGDVTQQEASSFLQAATIVVDPRFGSWDAERAEVVPPEGPSSPTTTAPLTDQLTGQLPTGEQTP